MIKEDTQDNTTPTHYQKYKETLKRYREKNRDKYNEYMKNYYKQVRADAAEFRKSQKLN